MKMTFLMGPSRYILWDFNGYFLAIKCLVLIYCLILMPIMTVKVRAHYPSGFSQIFQKWEVYQAVDIHLRE